MYAYQNGRNFDSNLLVMTGEHANAREPSKSRSGMESCERKYYAILKCASTIFRTWECVIRLAYHYAAGIFGNGITGI